MQYIEIGIKKENDKESLSDLYNIKGVTLQAEYDFEGAKEAYRKALDLNPSNVYASDNLEVLD